MFDGGVDGPLLHFCQSVADWLTPHHPFTRAPRHSGPLVVQTTWAATRPTFISVKPPLSHTLAGALNLTSAGT